MRLLRSRFHVLGLYRVYRVYRAAFVLSMTQTRLLLGCFLKSWCVQDANDAEIEGQTAHTFSFSWV